MTDRTEEFEGTDVGDAVKVSILDSAPGMVALGVVEYGDKHGISLLLSAETAEAVGNALIRAGSNRAASVGAEAIRRERCRQIEEEGFDATHDARENRSGNLLMAAVSYLVEAAVLIRNPGGRSAQEHRAVPQPDLWPWSPDWWKPKTPKRDLERAGALIAAQIDVLHQQHITEIRDLLEKQYLSGDIDAWLTAPHPQLEGRTAASLIAEGRTEDVLAILRRLDAAAYL